MSEGPCVGVDAGGSGSRARAVSASGELLAEVEGPPAAVDPADPDAAAERIAGLVRRALQAAGAGDAAALVAAVAGAGREEPRRAVEDALGSSGLADRVRVETDARAAFRDGFGTDGDGILLAAGTGSIALARCGGGEARAGGWGPALGDEGGGYDLARRALRRVARARDGRGAPTELTERLLAATGVTEPRRLIDWIARAERREVAALAPAVLDAAEAGDPVARRLASEAVASLSAAALAARRRTGSGSPSRVALSGGLLAAGGPLRRPVEDRLQALGLEVLPGSAASLPGACRLARELAAGPR